MRRENKEEAVGHENCDSAALKEVAMVKAKPPFFDATKSPGTQTHFYSYSARSDSILNPPSLYVSFLSAIFSLSLSLVFFIPHKRNVTVRALGEFYFYTRDWK